jgi:hypothetical protein
MAGQWSNFLRNLGEWHGVFTAISPSGDVLSDMPSILTLESGEQDSLGRVTMVLFTLRRFSGPDREGEPTSAMSQEYRSLGRQVVFFDSGTFCKGTLQMAPGTASGAEFGFVEGDRRHRLVMLHDSNGHRDQLVLIREHRAGSDAVEFQPLTASQLSGRWSGSSSVIASEWPEPEVTTAEITFEPQQLAELQFLPDGGYCRWPAQVSHRQPFEVEAGWFRAPERLDRLIRTYDSTGAWNRSIHQVLRREP